jgi:hypothetical protein
VKAAAPAADIAAETGPAGRSPSVIAVTGAVKAVGGTVTGAVTAVTRGVTPVPAGDRAIISSNRLHSVPPPGD